VSRGGRARLRRLQGGHLALERVRRDRSDLRHRGVRGQGHEVLDRHALDGARDLRFIRISGRCAECRRDDLIQHLFEAWQGRIERALLDDARGARAVEEKAERHVGGDDCRRDGVEHQSRGAREELAASAVA